MQRSGVFSRFAALVARWAGKPVSFIVAASIVVLWALSGPIFGFDERWQLIINSCTTIVTFLMVFILQNTQNRDNAAIQVKLDELLRVTDGTSKALLDLEELSPDDIEAIRARFEQLAAEAREGGERRGPEGDEEDAQDAKRTAADAS